MAERKRGPVKPPILDLTARPATGEPETGAPAPGAVPRPADMPPPADASEPEPAPRRPAQAARQAESGKASARTAQPQPAEADKPKPTFTPPPRPREPQPPVGLLLLTLVGGALLGTALTYSLATLGVWPRTGGEAASPAQLAALEQRLVPLELGAGTEAAQMSALAGRIEAIDGAIAPLAELGDTVPQLRSDIEALRQAPAAETPDLPALRAELASLSERLTALASQPRPSATPAQPVAPGASADELAALTQRVGALDARLVAAEAALDAGDAALAAIRTQVAAIPTASDPLAINAALKLPLLLDGLETAFATGRPFAAELASLAELAPSVAVPPGLAATAETGLPRPETLRQRFSAQLPAMLAARPVAADAEWPDAAWDRVRAFLALRPAGELEGDDPEAVASRLEAAMERNDFAAADALIAALPEPMRIAAGDLPQGIAAQAAATAFIADLRARALAADAAP